MSFSRLFLASCTSASSSFLRESGVLSEVDEAGLESVEVRVDARGDVVGLEVVDDLAVLVFLDDPAFVQRSLHESAHRFHDDRRLAHHVHVRLSAHVRELCVPVLQRRVVLRVALRLVACVWYRLRPDRLQGRRR